MPSAIFRPYYNFIWQLWYIKMSVGWGGGAFQLSRWDVLYYECLRHMSYVLSHLWQWCTEKGNEILNVFQMRRYSITLWFILFYLIISNLYFILFNHFSHIIFIYSFIYIIILIPLCLFHFLHSVYSCRLATVFAFSFCFVTNRVAAVHHKLAGCLV